MDEKSDQVYLAKLAEQAERYDGKSLSAGCEWDMFAAGIFFSMLANGNRAVFGSSSLLAAASS